MNKKQGNKLTISVILILFLSLLCSLGYIFYQNHTDNEPISVSDNIKTDTNETIKDNPAVNLPTDEGYLVIDNWGIKLKTSMTKDLTYQIYSRIGGRENTEYDGLGLKIKSESVTDQGCVGFGADLYRQRVPTQSFESVKLGEYYYYVTGAPGPCSDVPADLELQETILKELRVSSLEII